MAKKSAVKALTFLWALLIWITGIIVSLAVGFGMINNALVVPGLEGATVIAGYVVVIFTILGALLAIIDKLSS